MERVRDVFKFEKQNNVERAIENLKEIREEINDMNLAIISRIENIEDILIGESH